MCYPKRTDKPLYSGLVTQLESLSIPFPDAEQLQQHSLAEQYDLVLDSIFGFSFKGAPRPPFDKLLEVTLVCAGSAASASCLQHWRWLRASATAPHQLSSNVCMYATLYLLTAGRWCVTVDNRAAHLHQNMQ